jgi:type IV secretion system protein TrbI
MSEQDLALLDPDTAPEGGAGGRRVNSLPLVIGLIVVTLFVVIIAYVAWTRGDEQQPTHAQNASAPKAQPSDMEGAQAVMGAQTDGVVAPTQQDLEATSLDTPPMPPQGAASTVKPVIILRTGMSANDGHGKNVDLVAPKTPSISGGNGEMRLQDDDETRRLAQLKRSQFEEAVRSRSSLPFNSPKGSPTSIAAVRASTTAPGTREEMLARLDAARVEAESQGDAGSGFAAKLASVRNGLVGASVGDAAGSAPQRRGNNDVAQFAGTPGTDRWKLENKLEAPRSAYELRAGATLIPGTLIGGINSELPGQIFGQVSSNVFDTATGNHLLIPQGTRLSGVYGSEVVFAQARVLIAWQRLIFPDGRVLDIGAMPGADMVGFSGFSDKVDNHYWRLFSSAFLLSGVTAGVAVSQPSTTTTNGATTQQNFSGAMSQALGQQLGQVTAQLLTKNMNVAPTLVIRPGYRFNIVVTKDLTFDKPYKAFDY